MHPGPRKQRRTKNFLIKLCPLLFYCCSWKCFGKQRYGIQQSFCQYVNAKSANFKVTRFEKTIRPCLDKNMSKQLSCVELFFK